MDLAVANTGAVTAHVVSVYLNDELVNNSISTWISSASSAWTGNITLPSGKEIHPYDDRVMVSTDRGTTSTAIVQWSWLVIPPGNASETTPYCVNVQEINPQDPQKAHNPHLADVFRYSFWVIDYANFQGSRAAYLQNPFPPNFDPYDLSGANYSTPAAPEGFIGVQPGRTYAVWAVETQYRSDGELIWCRVGPADKRPLTVTIPADAETYVWVVRVLLTDYFGALLPHNIWHITIGGTDAKVGDSNPYAGSINFTGGENYENLKDVTLELHVYNASTGGEIKEGRTTYTIIGETPAGPGGPDNKVKFDTLINKQSYYYEWMIRWNGPAVTGKYRIKIYVEGRGEVTGNKYTTWSDNFCTYSEPSDCNVGDRYLDVAVTPT
jgi:hypothetical protein